jgi:hypothetical protein
MSGGRAAAWSLLIVAIGATAWGARFYSRSDEPEPPRRAAPAESVAVEIAPPKTPPIDWVAWREKAWTRIEPRLAEADRKAAAVIEEEIKSLGEFFEGRRAGVRPFAEAVLSMRGKWVYLKSKLPSAEDDAHLRYLNEQFEKHVFKIDDLRQAIEQSVTVQLGRMEGIENQLLAEIRDELSEGLPRGAPAIDIAEDEAKFRHEYGRLLSVVSMEVARDTKVALSREAGSLVAGEVAAVIAVRVATAVATRLGISGGVLGVGAASGWATFGIGLVAAVVIDFAIDKAAKAAGYDPVVKVSQKVDEVLSQVRTLLIDGDPDARMTLEKLKQMAVDDPDPTVRAECQKAVDAIDGGGQLGLRHEMQRLQLERAAVRRGALRRLVDGVGAEG